MEITGKKIECFELSLLSSSKQGKNDLLLGTFLVESKWNGMMSLIRGRDGQTMIVNDDTTGGVFDFGLFLGLEGEEKKFTVIKASPDLMHSIKEYIGDHAKAPEAEE